jgi:hypothetical protein
MEELDAFKGHYYFYRFLVPHGIVRDPKSMLAQLMVLVVWRYSVEYLLNWHQHLSY